MAKQTPVFVIVIESAAIASFEETVGLADPPSPLHEVAVLAEAADLHSQEVYSAYEAGLGVDTGSTVAGTRGRLVGETVARFSIFGWETPQHLRHLRLPLT